MGKTTFAVNLAERIAMKGKKCAFFSLELSEEPIAKKFSIVNSDMEIYIEDKPLITVLEIKQKVIDLKNVDCVVIDYFGLIRPEIKRTDKMQECHDISRDLKRMAKELDIPVICTTQLPRQVETDKRPTLSNFIDGVHLIIDADIMLFLYRQAYYSNTIDDDNTDIDDIDKAEVIIAKNRHGDIGTIELKFDREAIRFTELYFFDNYEICYSE